jgi:hypothetical protein
MPEEFRRVSPGGQIIFDLTEGQAKLLNRILETGLYGKTGADLIKRLLNIQLTNEADKLTRVGLLDLRKKEE